MRVIEVNYALIEFAIEGRRYERFDRPILGEYGEVIRFIEKDSRRDMGFQGKPVTRQLFIPQL